MSEASSRYNLAKQPEGVERIWKALERLGRKSKGGVPSFANNTELKFWLAAVGGRHEVHGDRPKADAYARCLENLGIAVMSESHGLLIDIERVAQLRDYTNDQVAWDERDDETLAARARWLEQHRVIAEQDADAQDVDETVVDAKAVEPAPKPKSPGERLAAAIARLRELRAKEQSADGVQTRITEIESSLETHDGELTGLRERVEAQNQTIQELEAKAPLAHIRVMRVRERIDSLEAQLVKARLDLDAEIHDQSELESQTATAQEQRRTSMNDLQIAEERYEELLEEYEELERQKASATLSSAEREEIGRIERALEALDSLNV